MKTLLAAILLFIPIGLMQLTYADTTFEFKSLTEKNNPSIGSITAKDTKFGLLITPQLTNLPAGLHGFHLHEKASCDNEGMAAGGHFDPKQTKKHSGPYNTKGHLGDMPALLVDANGNANLPILAPRLSEKTLRSHAMMVHSGSDNYADTPPMGGGGSRIACALAKATK